MYTDRDIKRFNNKYLIQESGCWEWQAAKKDGYGVFYHKGKIKFAHRVSYDVKFGLVENLVIDHLCRNTKCVNPQHLEQVTNAENVKRGMYGLMQTHCLAGHELNENNLYNSKIGKRVCKKCRTISRDKHRKK
jgi:hypothetical protein